MASVVYYFWDYNSHDASLAIAMLDTGVWHFAIK